MNPVEGPDMNLEPGELNVIDPREEIASSDPGDRAPAVPSAARRQTAEPAMGEVPGATRRIELDRLNAWYDDNHAVRDVSMSFEPGQVTAIIGPSGCGKSTMVRCVNRMHEEIPGSRSEG